MLNEARTLENELASMSIISERWEADALRYAKNAEYWQSRAEKAEDIIRSLCKICGTPIGAMVEDITPAAASQIPARSESKSPCPATD